MRSIAVLDANDIAPIEHVVNGERVSALGDVLAELSSSGTFQNPNFFAAAHSGRHARRLLWRDPADRFVIVAMTWAPNQGTPLHDHGGLWCAEVVVNGTMEESSYDAVEYDGKRGTRFIPTGSTRLPERSVALVLPPFEYHAYRNITSSVAHTVHVYAGLMQSCVAYTPLADDWWTGQRHALTYDA